MSDSKFRMEKMVKSVSSTILSGGYGPEAIEQFLTHLMSKAYEMGVTDSQPTIPVNDLSIFPEIFLHVSKRWTLGTCN